MLMAASARIVGCISSVITATFAGLAQFVRMSEQTARHWRGIFQQTWRVCGRMLNVPSGY